MKDAGRRAQFSTAQMGKQAETEGKFKASEQADLTCMNKGAITVGLFGNAEAMKWETNNFIC